MAVCGCGFRSCGESGKTFTYTNFNNGTAPLETSAVTAYALDLTSTIATTTSDASGLYSLAFPTAGQPRASVIAYEHLGYWTTSVYTDQPFDRDVMGLDTMHWRLGDGPLWSDSSMYGTLGATLDNTKGTLSVSVRDCADNIVEGVSFAITPSPQVGAYLDGAGLPSMTATSTVGPYTQYVAFNVQPGPTHIRASAAAMQFVDLDVVVKAGQNMTYTVVHPIE